MSVTSSRSPFSERLYSLQRADSKMVRLKERLPGQGRRPYYVSQLGRGFLSENSQGEMSLKKKLRLEVNPFSVLKDTGVGRD